MDEEIKVLISTYDEGIKTAINIPRCKMDNVRYIISHQKYEKWSQYVESNKNGFLYLKCDGKGLSKNRNNLLDSVKNDGIGVIADDDVEYEPHFFNIILNKFQEHDIDIGCFKIKTPPAEPEYKNYPSKEFKMNDLKSYVPSSIEIAFRVESIFRKKIRFDERFGLGGFYNAGEEKMFLKQAIDKGLNVWFFPEYIVKHPFQSTGKRQSKYSKEKLKYKGADYYLRFGLMGFFRAFFSPIKNLRLILDSGVNPFFVLKNYLIGYFYLLFTNNRKE